MATSSADSAPVLVVDDDELLARTIADVLELNGYTTRTATNGTRALALAPCATNEGRW